MPRQHLTPNACLVCRKKRTKCDGQMPCRRCRSRGEECAYEDKKWRTKDHLRSEIERLRSEQRQGHALIRALTNNDPNRWEAVLDKLRSDESPDDIADWIHSMRCLPCTPPRPSDGGQLDDATSYTRSPFRAPGLSSPEVSRTKRYRTPSMSSLSTRSFSQSGSSFESTPRTSFSTDFSPTSRLPFRNHVLCPPPPPPIFAANQAGVGNSPFRIREPIRDTMPDFDEPTLRTWTNVMHDPRVVHRLLAKFFTGCCPSLCIVSQPQFMKDFREGKSQYCSEALTNAILGRACKFFDTTSKLISRVTFGDAFLGEARRLLSAEQSHVNLPSIQALGVLALTEISQGNDEAAWDLAWESVRASIHLVLHTQHQDHQVDTDFRTVRALAYCGGFSLVRVLRLLTGRLEPNTGPLFMKLQPECGDLGEDAPHVRVERGISLQMQFFAELQYCHPIARFVFEVTEAVHTFAAYNFSKAMTAEDLEGAYEKCLDYHTQFTNTFGQNTDNSPDLLFAQIWYQYCLLSLLRPFVKTTASLKDNIAPKLRHAITPQTVCRQSSEAIIFLTSTYQTRYSLAYLPVLLPHMVFAAVLYQLTLAADPQYSNVKQEPAFLHSPVLIPPRPAPLGPPPPPPQTPIPPPPTVQMPFTAPPKPQQPACGLPPPPLPPSPTVQMEARRAARRRASALSSASNPSTSSSRTNLSGFTLQEKESISSDTTTTTSTGTSCCSDMALPLFTSEPSDLVTVGSLQLASMGAYHPNAAETARLLRSLAVARDQAGPNCNLETLVRSLPFPMDDFNASALLTGLGLEKEVVLSVNVDAACQGGVFGGSAAGLGAAGTVTAATPGSVPGSMMMPGPGPGQQMGSAVST
ncbi:hypothetical protein B0H66DRAFT_481924 [Apodospora peruviana]|uniref:Zn(2)-C6 fungal-type domain-containing protein n=1 Tax=Apodospora peruviana TaxID=516989 RepID=A0AAE0HXQ6_9PEZI|nr:hypothetical protein B0H66DRAFT_481924 [Apodospora peruviana]